MDSVKKGWYVCKSNFIQWRTNYRIWIIVAIETILVFRYLHGLSEYGQATGKTITPFVLPIVFAEAVVVVEFFELVFDFVAALFSYIDEAETRAAFFGDFAAKDLLFVEG